jgi:hypothetical protein
MAIFRGSHCRPALLAAGATRFLPCKRSRAPRAGLAARQRTFRAPSPLASARVAQISYSEVDRAHAIFIERCASLSRPSLPMQIHARQPSGSPIRSLDEDRASSACAFRFRTAPSAPARRAGSREAVSCSRGLRAPLSQGRPASGRCVAVHPVQKVCPVPAGLARQADGGPRPLCAPRSRTVSWSGGSDTFPQHSVRSNAARRRCAHLEGPPAVIPGPVPRCDES